ncbi:MAG TPA: hypothetical protein PKD91_03375 [Bacteroidia bacterium]|nr:hypothetical protein [Bacteroidia bacterium]
MKNKSEKTKNTILTMRAKGGAPSGQICPVNTTMFNTRSSTKIGFRGVVIEIY